MKKKMILDTLANVKLTSRKSVVQSVPKADFAAASMEALKLKVRIIHLLWIRKNRMIWIYLTPKLLGLVSTVGVKQRAQLPEFLLKHTS